MCHFLTPILLSNALNIQLLVCFVLELLFRPLLKDHCLSTEVNNRVLMSHITDLIFRFICHWYGHWFAQYSCPTLQCQDCSSQGTSSLFNHLLSHLASWYLSGLIMAGHLGYEAQSTNMTVHWKGANFIRESGAGQHKATWRLPLALQLLCPLLLQPRPILLLFLEHCLLHVQD